MQQLYRLGVLAAPAQLDSVRRSTSAVPGVVTFAYRILRGLESRVRNDNLDVVLFDVGYCCAPFSLAGARLLPGPLPKALLRLRRVCVLGALIPACWDHVCSPSLAELDCLTYPLRPEALTDFLRRHHDAIVTCRLTRAFEQVAICYGGLVPCWEE